MEIRAGAGGEEAALFCSNLARMYTRFAQKQGWRAAVLDSNQTSIGGLKEIIIEIQGAGAYDQLKQEGGVHRIQRIPKTEKSGRVHTSTATIAILPKVSEIEIKINPQDLRIETTRASGPGGQNVNKLETAVRIVHLPTGLVVSCQSERSQGRNKEKAMEIMRARLFNFKQKEQLSQISTERREQIGTADRSEKIRTYNFPQNRVTDHRLNKSWHNLENIMDGDLNSIVKAFKNK